MSTTRLLVLGVVRLFQPVHGYEVRRELITWRVSEWGSIQTGSIYNALKTLTRDGFLEVVGTDQVGGRPERTTYQLTDAGDEEFRHLLREEWWTVRSPIDPLMGAVSFLNGISRAEAIAALEHRIAHIRGASRHTEFAIAGHDGTESPDHVREMLRLMDARMLAEVAWAEAFIARLKQGEYSTGDDPPWSPVGERAPSHRRRGASTDRAPSERRRGAPTDRAPSPGRRGTSTDRAPSQARRSAPTDGAPDPGRRGTSTDRAGSPDRRRGAATDRAPSQGRRGAPTGRAPSQARRDASRRVRSPRR